MISLDDQRDLARIEKNYLEPPDEEEYEHKCCMCDQEAEYSVMGDLYCERCLLAEFKI